MRVEEGHPVGGEVRGERLFVLGGGRELRVARLGHGWRVSVDGGPEAAGRVLDEQLRTLVGRAASPQLLVEILQWGFDLDFVPSSARDRPLPD